MNIQDMDKAGTFKFHLRSDLHVIRKLWHVGTGLVGLYFYYKSGLTQKNVSYVLLILASIGFLVDFIRLKYSVFNQLVMKVMGPFMRESERTSYSGFPFYALGTALSLFFFSEKIAILSILFLVFSDPISSYFGILYGKDKILPNKSLQGTVAGYLCCYMVTLIYGMAFSEPGIQLLIFSIFGGLIGAISELLSELVDDNLTIPFVSGAGLTFINLFIPLF